MCTHVKAQHAWWIGDLKEQLFKRLNEIQCECVAGPSEESRNEREKGRIGGKERQGEGSVREHNNHSLHSGDPIIEREEREERRERRGGRGERRGGEGREGGRGGGGGRG
mgnify:CR=1 FL=1